MPDTADSAEATEARVFYATLAGALVVAFIAVLIAALSGLAIAPLFAASPYGVLRAAVIGAGATVPLVIALLWFMRATHPALAAFRESQIQFLANIGFALTAPRIALIGLAAGLSEEFMFRGVLQTLAAANLPIAAAIVAPNIVFGLLHARTTLYAVVAGAVGIYLGALYWATQSLWTPIITHALYDVAALEIARRALAARESAPSVS